MSKILFPNFSRYVLLKLLLHLIRILCVIVPNGCKLAMVWDALVGHIAQKTVAIVLNVDVNPPMPSGTLDGAWISTLLFMSPIGIFHSFPLYLLGKPAGGTGFRGGKGVPIPNLLKFIPKPARLQEPHHRFVFSVILTTYNLRLSVGVKISSYE